MYKDKEKNKQLMIEKRKNLSAISRIAKTKAEHEGINLKECFVNDLIIKYCYTKNGHDEFNSFMGWMVKGYRVKKGEKGFMLWSRPISVIKTEANKPTDEDESNFYSISYVFSNLQVEPITVKS